MSKIKLVIISERTRAHFQAALKKFDQIEVVHLYRYKFTDMNIPDDDHLIQFSSCADLYKKLQQLKPDLVQSLEPYYGYSRFRIPLKVLPIIRATRVYCRRYKVKYFIHFLENIAPERKYGWPFYLVMKQIARSYCRRASFIFYLNEGAKRNLLALKVPEAKMISGLWGIWGVDIKKYVSKAQERRGILFVGRLDNQKGILDLIEAFRLAKDQAQDLKLKIVGTGPLLEEVQDKIAAYQLIESIELIGEVKSDQVIQYYQAAKFLVVPSKTLRYSAEQVGMVMIEAMSCGVPVIAYDSGSIGEFVRESSGGTLVKESDVCALAKKIVDLWRDNKGCIVRSNLAREYVQKNFDIDKNVSSLETIILSRFVD